MTSHAAVVAARMGKPCVVGCGAADDRRARRKPREAVTLGGDYDLDRRNGDVISLDGTTRRHRPRSRRADEARIERPRLRDLHEMGRPGPRASRSAPTPTSRATRQAPSRFGAEGIGLCRTEHMFFDAERMPVVREMILAETDRGPRAALAKLLPFQRADFAGHLRRHGGQPGHDPPARSAAARVPAATRGARCSTSRSRKNMNITVEKRQSRCTQLHEFNPMLGHRGCRLGITFPEINEMQARAIFEAAGDAKRTRSASPRS